MVLLNLETVLLTEPIHFFNQIITWNLLRLTKIFKEFENLSVEKKTLTTEIK